MNQWNVIHCGICIGYVRRVDGGPLGTMYEARDGGGKLIASHGGGTPREQRRRAYAAVKEHHAKRKDG